MKGPVKVVEFDISDPSAVLGDDGVYKEAFVLVRCGPYVLKNLRMRFRDGQITREEVMHADRHRVGYHLVLENLRKFAALPVQESVGEVPITVVVCTRNRTDMLVHCLAALKKQHYSQFEVLVVDNAPDDDRTKDLVDMMGMRYVIEPKPGLDRARNRGVMEASHGIIAFTDDDARPDRFWLQAVARGFRDPGVTALTGFVAPAEMETHAQQMFEWAYGGMGHGFARRVYDGGRMSNRQKLGVSVFGVGANMAFRKEWFSRGGLYDPALDVGTPSSGGGDLEMFHRVVAMGEKLVYEPDMLVWHTHRRTMDDLHRQVFNNGRSFVCYLLTCFRNGTSDLGNVLAFFFRNWLYDWHLKNLFLGGGRVSRRLLVTEMKGMLTGPAAYFKSRRVARKLDGV